LLKAETFREVNLSPMVKEGLLKVSAY